MSSGMNRNLIVGSALVAGPSRCASDNRDGLPTSGSPTRSESHVIGSVGASIAKSARAKFAALVGVGLALLALTGCGDKAAAAGGAKPRTKIILQTDWYAQPEHGGFYQALVKGYYRDAGLEVEIAQGGPNSMPTQKVVMGQAHFGIGRSDELIVAAGRDVPTVMVGALMQRDPQAIMFHEEAGIRDFKDLDGRSIMAVPGANWITLMEKKYGIKVSVTPLDFGLSRFLADKKFVQQCFITNEPFYVKQQGAKPATLLLSNTGFSPYRVWYTSRAFIEKNPEAVRAFTAASIRGWSEYLEGDRVAADAAIGKLNKQMVPEFIAFSVAAMKQHGLVAGEAAKGERVGRIDPARITTEIKQLADIGVLGRPVTLAEVFDDRFLPAEVRAPAPAR
jgi:NitT/TauT family transport system substrate-binding protein